MRERVSVLQRNFESSTLDWHGRAEIGLLGSGPCGFASVNRSVRRMFARNAKTFRWNTPEYCFSCLPRAARERSSTPADNADLDAEISPKLRP